MSVTPTVGPEFHYFLQSGSFLMLGYFILSLVTRQGLNSSDQDHSYLPGFYTSVPFGSSKHTGLQIVYKNPGTRFGSCSGRETNVLQAMKQTLYIKLAFSIVLNKSFTSPVYLTFLSFNIKAWFVANMAKEIRWGLKLYCSNLIHFFGWENVSPLLKLKKRHWKNNQKPERIQLLSIPPKATIDFTF